MHTIAIANQKGGAGENVNGCGLVVLDERQRIQGPRH